jgi:hypothetical protein
VAACLAPAFATTHRAGAAVTGPYTPDANTLHLWHLDEAGAPAADSVSGANNLPMNGLLNNAVLGVPSFTGFGTSLDTSNTGTTTNRPILLAAPAVANGTADNVPFSHADPATGAFTIEAIVRFAYDPSGPPAGRNNSLQVVSMDGEAGPERVFQFRIDPIGFTSGTSDVNQNRLEFINILGGAATSFVVNLPNTGLNAPELGSWFHVAAAYNGVENTPNNLSLYWTKLDPTATEAALLAQAQMTADMITTPGDFAIGNEGRSTGNESENFLGQVDEVRISSIARGPGEFIFVPEPSTAGLLAAGALGVLARRCRR